MTPTRRLLGHPVPMRDGAALASDIFLPPSPGPSKAILVRTPYERVQPRFGEWAEFFTGHGYAFIAQDVRGRGDSEGEWTPWVSEFDDGYDAIEWVAGQPWCDGAVGTLGGSYEGWVQWAAATRRPPHLTTMITSGSPGRWFRNWPHRYGAFMAPDYLEWINRTAGRTVQQVPFDTWRGLLAFRDLRSIDTQIGRPLAAWQECLGHQALDDYWARMEVGGYELMDYPVLHVSGWFDALLIGEIHHFQRMLLDSPARVDQTLIVGPWNHGGAVLSGEAVPGEVWLGPGASLDIRMIWLAWFDRYLKGQPAEPWPRVVYFQMGSNTWRHAASWPPEDSTEVRLHLDGGGRLSQAPPNTGEDAFVYDPGHPLLTFSRLDAPDPLDGELRWEVPSEREDVLQYTTEALEEPLEVAGPVEATLFVSTTADDTDFVVTVSDLAPDGRCLTLTHGIRRASFRESLSNPTPVAPGETFSLRIEISDLAHTFPTGHRLSIAISSSLFPYYHPNPNSFAGYATEARGRPATQRVLRGHEHPSSVLLRISRGRLP